MCDRLNEVLAAARAAVGCLDVASLSPAQAAKAVELGAELEKLGSLLRVLVAPKVAQSDAWAR